MSSFSVVQARLIAPEETRQYLWQLMAEPYSQLVKAHLDYLSSHPDFESWLSEFQIPASVINEFAKTCKTQSPYQDLPGRFATRQRHWLKPCTPRGLP